MSCNFALPDLPLRVPGFSLPPLPSIPSISIDLDIDPPELPTFALRVPGFSLPPVPSLPEFGIDLDIDPPELPVFAVRVPGFSLPSLSLGFSFAVACPFD